MNLAIKLPNDPIERILCFPFLHALVRAHNLWTEKEANEERSEDDKHLALHLIADEAAIDLLNLLPFNAYYHQLEKDDQKNVFNMHRAIKNSKLDRIDVFMSLTESMLDATIGKNLNAPVRMGVDTPKTKLFFNQRFQFTSRPLKTHRFAPMLNELYPGIDWKGGRATSRDIGACFSDWQDDPYLVVLLEGENSVFDQELIDFVDLFENYKFVFIYQSDEEESLQEYYVKEYIKKLNPKNRFEYFATSSCIESAQLLAYAKALIARDSLFSFLMTYCAGVVYWINKDMAYKEEMLSDFLGEVHWFDYTKQTENFDELFDVVYPQIVPVKELEEE